MKKVKKETGILTTTEVANANHVDLALKNEIDILWIGARTVTSNVDVDGQASLVVYSIL